MIRLLHRWPGLAALLLVVLLSLSGAALSGRLAGHIAPHRQVRHGFAVMATAALLNLVLAGVITGGQQGRKALRYVAEFDDDLALGARVALQLRRPR